MKAIVIEDESELAKSITGILKDEGYLVDSVASFEEASLRIWDHVYDVVILDIMLPDGNGIDLIKDIKEKQSEAGIIIISAKDSLSDKLEGLDLGADDYLTKPFYLAELNSRIKALNRRRLNNGNSIVEFNEIKIDLDERQIGINDQTLEVTKKEFDLLLFLISNKNKVLTKETITEHLWGDFSFAYDNFDFIYSHIRNLRNKIKKSGGNDYIKTVYGIGYKFSKV
jgi:DNA-binding response OmpR family regulator